MTLEDTKEAREKRILTLLFVSLIIIGVFFYNMSGRSIGVLSSGIVALVFYVCMDINKYYMRSFSERLHWWLRIGTTIAGIVFLFITISA